MPWESNKRVLRQRKAVDYQPKIMRL